MIGLEPNCTQNWFEFNQDYTKRMARDGVKRVGMNFGLIPKKRLDCRIF